MQVGNCEMAGLAGVFFIIIVPIVYIHRRQKKNSRRQRNVEFQSSMEQSHEEYMKNLWDMSHRMNQIRHDLNGSMDILYRLVKKGQAEEALRYIEKRNIEIKEYQELPEDTGNEGINAALIKAVHESREKKICFRYMVSGKINGMDSMDMGIMFYNLLSNAIEACVRCEAQREIELEIMERNNRLYCRLENSIKNSVLKENPKLKTVKPDKNRHGFGMKSIREIIKKYGGNYCCSEEGGVFVQEIWLERRGADSPKK